MEDRTLKAWQIIVESTLKNHLEKRYPGEMATYMRFRKTTGSNCAFCKSAAKIMFKSEAIKDREFLGRFQRNEWEGYV